MLIIPGAFVDLSTEQVLNLPVWNQIKIFTAGVWHNIALSLLSIFLLLSNPYLLSPLYSSGQGVVVADIDFVSEKYIQATKRFVIQKVESNNLKPRFRLSEMIFK